MELPVKFLENMKTLLGDEYEAFLHSYDEKAFQGIRLNTLKCDEKKLRDSLPFEIEPSPFSPFSYYGSGEKFGNLPAHHAGMFYSQEPSASCAVTVLDPQPGEKILDLCAAPGGKSTQIAALLSEKGLLWSNEIQRSRAAALLSNIERMGCKNAVVSSCHPERLCSALFGYFDRVLVDAPCSGEGMFRKDEEAIRQWTPDSNRACANRQAEILDCAARAVKEGGILVYSTCTFSREENEDAILSFLNEHPEFEFCEFSADFGRKAFSGVSGVRVFPMDGGEGHFVAKLRRTDKIPCKVKQFEYKAEKEAKEIERLWREIFFSAAPDRIYRHEDKFYALPSELPEFSGLGVMRAGVEIGEIKGKHLEPSHGAFMCAKAEECRNLLDFSPDAAGLEAFLRGEETDCSLSGYTAAAVNGVVTGFGKASGGRLKNRYPKGLRVIK